MKIASASCPLVLKERKIMHVMTEYPDGIFSWVDLTTPDLAGAKVFYSGLFGWEAADTDTDQGTIYSMMRLDGKTVAGIGPMDAGMKAQGVPPIWTSYVNHSDIDGVAARITEAGGSLMFPPMDVMEEGRMVLAMDPTGAAFGVWQPNHHIGAQLVNMPNTLVWNELQTRAKDAAVAFYAHVFGWTTSEDPNGYGMFAQDGRVQAGMMQMDDSMAHVPPNWTVYFMVENVEAAAAQVQELGGAVIVPPTQAGEMGRFSVVQDPQGGVFTVMQFSGPVDLPPGA